MARRRSFTIAGRFFRTKKELEAAAKRLRDSLPMGVPIDASSHAFVLDLFEQLYPDWVAKTGGAMVRTIQVTFIDGGRCFQMALAGGRVIEPSLRVCFQPSLVRSRPTAFATMRREVWSQVVAYRDAYFQRHANSEGRAPCELTGQLILPGREFCNIDHVPPDTFKSLVDEFLSGRGLTLEAVRTKEAANGVGDVLADRAFALEWQRFHQQRARLRVLARTEHVRLTREQQQDPVHAELVAILDAAYGV